MFRSLEAQTKSLDFFDKPSFTFTDMVVRPILIGHSFFSDKFNDPDLSPFFNAFLIEAIIAFGFSK